MSLAQPGWLFLLPLVAVLGLLGVGMGILHVRRLGAVVHGELLERVLPRTVRRRRWVRLALVVCGLALVVVALAQPRFDKELKTIKAKGVDLVIAVDLSRSMDARDVQPSRLEQAKREVADLLDVIEGDRVGLVVFAGGAISRLPLTQDYRALDMVRRELDTTTFEAQGSAMGEAVRVGMRLLSGGDERAGKAILLITDGEIHEPADALAAADEAAEAGVVVYGLLVGEEAAPIFNRDGSYLTHQGNTVYSTPSSEILVELARRTGGAYVKSVPSTSDITGLYQSEMREKLTAVENRIVQREQWRSGHTRPLWVGFLLLLGAAWLGDGRRPWGAAAAALACLLLVSPPVQAASLAQGDQLYRQGRYKEAARELTEVSLLRPDDPGVFDRLGAARYRAGDFEGAVRAWSQEDRLRGGADAETAFDLGNGRYLAGRLTEALKDYERALQLDPENARASYNKGLLEQELAARRQQQQQQEEQQQGQDEPNASENQQGESSQQQQDGDGQPPPGGQPQDPNSGEPSGQNDDSKSDQPSESEEGANGESQEPKDPGSGQATEERPEGSADPVSLEDVQSEGTPGEGGTTPSGEELAPSDRRFTVAQADKLLDGVEEGRPRVYVPGGNSAKPW